MQAVGLVEGMQGLVYSVSAVPGERLSSLSCHAAPATPEHNAELPWCHAAGWAADKYGRDTVLRWAGFVALVSAVVTALAVEGPDYTVQLGLLPSKLHWAPVPEAAGVDAGGCRGSCVSFLLHSLAAGLLLVGACHAAALAGACCGWACLERRHECRV